MRRAEFASAESLATTEDPTPEEIVEKQEESQLA